MESEVLPNCQWNKCNAPAAKHMVFGLRVFEASAEIHASDAVFDPDHLDLCEKHVELIRLTYVRVTAYDLGACPDEVRHSARRT